MAHAGGRPTVMTDKVLGKLQEAFLLDCTDEEACLNADISPDTLYSYQREHPEFIKKKQAWKQNPFLIARRTIVRDIGDDSELALKYMSKKKKDEFSDRQEHTGKDGKDLLPSPILGGQIVPDHNGDAPDNGTDKAD